MILFIRVWTFETSPSDSVHQRLDILFYKIFLKVIKKTVLAFKIRTYTFSFFYLFSSFPPPPLCKCTGLHMLYFKRIKRTMVNLSFLCHSCVVCVCVCVCVCVFVCVCARAWGGESLGRELGLVMYLTQWVNVK